MSILRKSIFIVIGILFLDQFVKIWIKTHMTIGQELQIFDHWFIIHFTENNGMAFGFEFGGNMGKIFLSLFRIAALIGIGWYIYILSRKKTHTLLIVSLSMIMAGALGNIIDSLFYGMIFNNSFGQVATLFPADGGYSSFLHGRVVDMFYFPVIHTHFPSWSPLWPKEEFIFFRPIFNISDSSITTGVFLILIFQKKLFRQSERIGSFTSQDNVEQTSHIDEHV
ncbi:MAG: lipoprotein signal peptidase [Bacteroidia bacterium]|nr:lipoprotein signal peptidase [Bacteroidia bacterium]